MSTDYVDPYRPPDQVDQSRQRRETDRSREAREVERDREPDRQGPPRDETVRENDPERGNSVDEYA